MKTQLKFTKPAQELFPKFIHNNYKNLYAK